MSVIIVGADHSEGAREALRFAFEDAELRKATLRAVHAWQFGYIGAPAIEGSVPVLGADLSEHRAAADAALAATVRETIPRPCWSRSRAARICWWSVRADMAGSRSCSWGP